MRIFTASIGCETNTFSPVPTRLSDYEIYPPGKHPDDGPRQCTAQLWIGRRRAVKDGFTLLEGSCFHAGPGGRTNRADYEAMRGEILAQLTAALPVDAIVFGMHGAMAAFGYDDVEGDLLARTRTIVGQECVIGVEMDPHCHLTIQRLSLADAIVMYKEYPHTDATERAEEVYDIVLGTLAGRIKPVMSAFDCQQVGSFPTTHPAMRALVDEISALEGKDGVLSISIGHSYPYADVSEMGCRVLVISDSNKAVADRVAAHVGRKFQALRGVTTPTFHGIDDGIDAALALTGAPIIITDASDNAGGGAPSDNTAILRRLIERGIESAALGPLYDPMAVHTCFAAGLGAELALRIGGKTCIASGSPVDAIGLVVGLKRDGWQTYGTARAPLGDMAAVRIGGVDVVLNNNRTQAFGLELFTNVGIEPGKRKLLVLKSSNHFRAAYDAVMQGLVERFHETPHSLASQSDRRNRSGSAAAP